MKPDALESLRGIQASLLEVVAPELTSAHAQETLQTMVMLLESLAAEWDDMVENLIEDCDELTGLLQTAVRTFSGATDRDRAKAVAEIASFQFERPPSFRVSELAAYRAQLSKMLEAVVVVIEQLDLDARDDLWPFRERIYQHLRKESTRGWSFWDGLGFRDSMPGQPQESTL